MWLFCPCSWGFRLFKYAVTPVYSIWYPTFLTYCCITGCFFLSLWESWENWNHILGRASERSQSGWSLFILFPSWAHRRPSLLPLTSDKQLGPGHHAGCGPGGHLAWTRTLKTHGPRLQRQMALMGPGCSRLHRGSGLSLVLGLLCPAMLRPKGPLLVLWTTSIPLLHPGPQLSLGSCGPGSRHSLPLPSCPSGLATSCPCACPSLLPVLFSLIPERFNSNTSKPCVKQALENHSYHGWTSI